MSRYCTAVNCGNGDYLLERWKAENCLIHKGQQHHSFEHGPCGCKPEFELYDFPTKRSNAVKRDIWIKLLNRTPEVKSTKFWIPGPQGRVCSKHFEANNEYPILYLNYPESEARKKLKYLQSRRK